MQRSEPDFGVTRDTPIALAQWSLGAGTIIPARADGAVGREAVATSLSGIIWDDTADQTDTIRLDYTLPGQFKSQAVNKNDTPVLKLLVKARVRDTTGSAGANTNLALNAQMFFHGVGDTALSTLAAAVSVVVGAIDYADATEEGFAWYEYDLYAAMSAAQKLSLIPLETIQIILGPNEAVGTALYIDVIGTVLRMKEHPSLESKSAR
jgi:hypothetical protein